MKELVEAHYPTYPHRTHTTHTILAQTVSSSAIRQPQAIPNIATSKPFPIPNIATSKPFPLTRQEVSKATARGSSSARASLPLTAALVLADARCIKPSVAVNSLQTPYVPVHDLDAAM